MVQCAPSVPSGPAHTASAELVALVLISITALCDFAAGIFASANGLGPVKDVTHKLDSPGTIHSTPQYSLADGIVAPGSLRQLNFEQHHDVRDEDLNSLQNDGAAHDTIAVADSLTTQQRIARLHQHFQQQKEDQGDEQVCPASVHCDFI